MIPRLVSVTLSFCIAMLPVAILSGIALILPETLMPSPSYQPDMTEIAEAIFAMSVIAYMFGSASTLPFFVFFRAGAGWLKQLTYRAAAVSGGLTGVGSYALTLFNETASIDEMPFFGGYVAQGAQFAMIGVISGLLYWWLEQAITRALAQSVFSKKGLST